LGSVPGADDDDLFGREDAFGGSVPGADDNDLFGREDAFGGSVPGADDNDLFDGEDAFESSVPSADDDPFDAGSPLAARLYEPPAPITATVARAASGRSSLLMFAPCVWRLHLHKSHAERARHRCILGSCAASAYMAGHP
jgi:hypothetical protein